METTTVSKNIIDASSFDLNLLTVFCLIYSTRSVSSTAQLLNISPSAVSQSLKKLRTQFSDHLFIRNGNELLPTLFASELYQASNEIIMKVGFFLSKNSTSLRKKIAIDTALSLSPLFIPAVTKMMSEEFPDFTILHHEESMTENVIKEKLNLRQTDIIFSPSRIDTPSLISKKILDLTFILIARQLPQRKTRMSLAELQQADLISLNGIGDLFVYYSHEFQRRYHLKPRRLITTSLESMLHILSTSPLMGMLPDKLFTLYQDKYHLQAVDNELITPTVSLFMTYRREMEEHETFRHIVNGIQKCFGPSC